MTAVADAVESGVLGGRLWFYSNYHCNLACAYCLTDSAPRVRRRVLGSATMVEMAAEAAGVGFSALGITGGEPFLMPDMPRTVARLAGFLPTVVLTNGTLVTDRLLPRLEPLADLRVAVQVSLDSADAAPNDGMRGRGNFAQVVAAITRLKAAGLRVRVATTSEGLPAEDRARLCALHRSLGVDDEDHVVRPIVRRGRAATQEMGIEATASDLPAELTITADGAFWSPFGPTVRGERLDTDLLITRTIRPLSIPAAAMLRVAEGRARGDDASLGIR
jgi:MoaA/NifB/PqqE/SkfB family radical SAM enzyme